MWPFRNKKKTFVTTSDGSLGFFKEDYVRHSIYGGKYSYQIKIELKGKSYYTDTVYADYPDQKSRTAAFESLNQILTTDNKR
jgi:hypothetical protein